MEPVIRDATEADLAAINDIYNHYVRTCTCTYQEQPDTAADRQEWFEAHGPKHPVIVAEADGQVVAWGSLSKFGRNQSWDAYRFTAEDSVYVRPDMKGRGLGRIILSELINRAKALGYHSIFASISADQTASIALHEKFGFAKVGRLPEIGYKFDKWLDVVYMQKML